ncbi:hypothetical protein ACFV42_49825, partial [Streptomyces solisilvae]|uniref:hypothetical protein n=2 Tax=Streptomyces TaxID=1883 RepID=UPI00367FA091
MTVEHGTEAPQGQVIQGEVVQAYPEYAKTDNLPARPEDLQGLNTGLEDLSLDEIPTPRISINHARAVYTDNQTGQEYPEFVGIPLGFVRQRIMWPKELPESGAMPMCKSNDSDRGLPNVDPTSETAFPWQDSSFKPNEVPVDPEYGRVILPCSNCVFKDWTGKGKRTPPRCSEVFNLIVLFDPYGTGNLQPAFFSVKRSGMKPLKTYLARFVQNRTPAYSEFARFSLQSLKRGQNDYSVPVISALGPTDPQHWQAFSENYATLREFSQRIRVVDEGGQQGLQQEFEES